MASNRPANRDTGTGFGLNYEITISLFEDGRIPYLYSRCFRCIRDNDEEEFRKVLEIWKRDGLSTYKRKYNNYIFINDLYLYDRDTLLLLVLYNRPAFIKLFRDIISTKGRLLDPADLDFCRPFEVVDIAKCLGYVECLKQLSTIIHIDENVNSPKQIFYILMTAFEKHIKLECNPGVLEKSFHMLFHNGYHVNSKDNDGRTPVDYVLQDFCTLPCLMMIVKFGADIDQSDQNGKTLFAWIITEACRYKPSWLFNLKNGQFEVVEIVKLCLYANPNVKFNQNVIEEVMVYDWDLYLSNRSIRNRGNFDNLRLAPLFYRAGFDISKKSSHFMVIDASDNIATGKRKLQDLCKLALRQSLPGMSLHKYVDASTTSKLLKDYVLLEEFNIAGRWNKCNICAHSGIRNENIDPRNGIMDSSRSTSVKRNKSSMNWCCFRKPRK